MNPRLLRCEEISFICFSWQISLLGAFQVAVDNRHPSHDMECLHRKDDWTGMSAGRRKSLYIHRAVDIFAVCIIIFPRNATDLYTFGFAIGKPLEKARERQKIKRTAKMVLRESVLSMIFPSQLETGRLAIRA